MKAWISSFLSNTLARPNPEHKKDDNGRLRNSKPFTTDSSYTFQRSPLTTSPQNHRSNEDSTPNLMLDVGSNTVIHPGTFNGEISSIRAPRNIEFSTSRNTSRPPFHISTSPISENVLSFSAVQNTNSNTMVNIQNPILTYFCTVT